MIRVITFDLDDTLWDVRPALVKAEAAQNQWLRTNYPETLALQQSGELTRLRQQVFDEQPELAHNISGFRRAVLQLLLTECGVPVDQAREAAGQAFAAFIARRNEVELFPQAVPVLTELATQYRLGSLTNGNADVAKTPLGRFFDFALKAEDVGAAKPEPALFQHAMRESGVTAGQMVHVGDSHDHDVTGAHRAGVRSIWLSAPGQESPLADGIINCLSELPDALRRLNTGH